MTSDEFRARAHEFVDWMADYLEHVEALPVKARVEPGQVLIQLPAEPPQAPEPMSRIFADFRSVIVPGMTHWQHPNFHAYFPANSSRPSVLAEMLTATLAAQCMSWETSPAATELEIRVLEWLRQMMGLPAVFVGSIQDTASTATLCAILAGRERATGHAVNERGAASVGAMTVYCSAEAHASVEKDARIAGIGRENVRLVPVDAGYGMVPEALEHAIASDVAGGLLPVCVIATSGTTAVSGFDPLRPIGEIARRHSVWLHVDAAWAGSAFILPEYRHLSDGIADADSIVFNPHKWLFTNFDCSVLFVRDVDTLLRTLSMSPQYLKTRHDATVTNYRDWGIQLGRRFRALKLWFVIRSYGVDGLRARLRAHIQMAHDLARQIDDAPDFELVVPPTLSLLCFRYAPSGLDPAALNSLNECLLRQLNDGGKVYLTQARIGDMFVIRFVVGQTETAPRHVTKAWEVIQEVARGLVQRESGAGSREPNRRSQPQIP